MEAERSGGMRKEDEVVAVKWEGVFTQDHRLTPQTGPIKAEKVTPGAYTNMLVGIEKKERAL